MVDSRSVLMFAFIILFVCGIFFGFSCLYGMVYGILFSFLSLSCGIITAYLVYKYTTTPTVITPIACSFSSVVSVLWASSYIDIFRNNTANPLVILLCIASGGVANVILLLSFRVSLFNSPQNSLASISGKINQKLMMLAVVISSMLIGAIISFLFEYGLNGNEVFSMDVLPTIGYSAIIGGLVGAVLSAFVQAP